MLTGLHMIWSMRGGRLAEGWGKLTRSWVVGGGGPQGPLCGVLGGPRGWRGLPAFGGGAPQAAASVELWTLFPPVGSLWLSRDPFGGTRWPQGPSLVWRLEVG
jgi:hypothetical protein